MRWLGIDAGGTKTAFATYDETLTQLDRFELPTSHYAQAGFDGMEAVLAEGIARAEAAGSCLCPTSRADRAALEIRQGGDHRGAFGR